MRSWTSCLSLASNQSPGVDAHMTLLLKRVDFVAVREVDLTSSLVFWVHILIWIIPSLLLRIYIIFSRLEEHGSSSFSARSIVCISEVRRASVMQWKRPVFRLNKKCSPYLKPCHIPQFETSKFHPYSFLFLLCLRCFKATGLSTILSYEVEPLEGRLVGLLSFLY